eukprot:scaffold1182_cov396-Prasinococcus_capsulatus_cf.AAC.10
MAAAEAPQPQLTRRWRATQALCTVATTHRQFWCPIPSELQLQALGTHQGGASSPPDTRRHRQARAREGGRSRMGAAAGPRS